MPSAWRPAAERGKSRIDRFCIGTGVRPVFGANEKGTGEQQSRLEAVGMHVDRCACLLDRSVDFSFRKDAALASASLASSARGSRVIDSASARRACGRSPRADLHTAKDRVGRRRSRIRLNGGLRRLQRFVDLPIVEEQTGTNRQRFGIGRIPLEQIRQDGVRLGFPAGRMRDDGDAAAGAGASASDRSKVVSRIRIASASRRCCV